MTAARYVICICPKVSHLQTQIQNGTSNGNSSKAFSGPICLSLSGDKLTRVFGCPSAQESDLKMSPGHGTTTDSEFQSGQSCFRSPKQRLADPDNILTGERMFSYKHAFKYLVYLLTPDQLPWVLSGFLEWSQLL